MVQLLGAGHLPMGLVIRALSLRATWGWGEVLASTSQGHCKAPVTALPKQKCKLVLQHHTATWLHKSKGMVGK